MADNRRGSVAYLVALTASGRANTWSVAGDVVSAGVQGPALGTIGEHLAISQDGQYVAIPLASGVVDVYQWLDDHVGALVDSVTVAGPANGVAWSPDGTTIVIAHDTSPFVSAFLWTSAGFGVQYANPATLPTGNANAVAWDPLGTFVAVAHATSPFVSVYPWSAGFGAKVADPATLPGAAGVDVRWRPVTGSHLMVMWTGDPGFAVYPWSTAGFGVKLTDPTTTANQAGLGADWSRDGLQIAIADGNVTLGCHFYGFDGTTISDVVTLSLDGDYADDVRFSVDGGYVAFNLGASPFMVVYKYSPNGPGTMQALNAISDVGGDNAHPLIWGVGPGGAAIHPVNAPIVPYEVGAPGNWPTEVPIEAARALDLLAAQVQELQSLVDYIVAQTGIVPPAEAMPPLEPLEIVPDDDSPSDTDDGTMAPLL